jgi:hypothetical protein
VKQLLRFKRPWCAALFVLALLPAPAAAAGARAICTADLLIFTTSPGVVSNTGNVTHFRDSGVGGGYISGFLAGAPIAGTQDIELNNATQQAQLKGSFVATRPAGTLTISYTGHADFTTGTATGHYVTVDGTGQFADFHWEGGINARLIGPAAFHATDSGPCHSGP